LWFGLVIAAWCAGCETPAPAPVSDAQTLDLGVDASAGACARPFSVERVEDLGAFSLPSPVVLSRDGTSSGEFRGRVVWTFGDTFLTRRNTIDNSSVLSATAGWSRAAMPLTLDEPVDDAGLPAQLIPYTEDELRTNRADALNGWALWPGAVIDTGAPEALVLFQRVRRMNGSGFASTAVATARLAAGSTRATRGATDLFQQSLDAGATAPSTLYGAGGVSVLDGVAYFFACSTVGFLNQGCRVARVPVARADDRAAFTFFDGSAWTSDMNRAAVVIDHVAAGVSITRNPYLGCYLAVTGTVFRSALTLRTSDRIEGGWSAQAGATLEAAASGPILPAVMGEYDYLFLEHPALRSADGRQIVVSYSRPLGNFRGEVRLARITLRVL
jgi:hypothetical protein